MPLAYCFVIAVPLNAYMNILYLSDLAWKNYQYQQQILQLNAQRVLKDESSSGWASLFLKDKICFPGWWVELTEVKVIF